MKQPLSFFFTLLILQAPIVAAGQVTNQNLFDTIPFLPDHYRERVALFNKQPVETGKIIFLGNSIIEGGNWPKLTGISSIVNRGIGGDITYGVLQRLDDVIRRQPSKLFILIGINDIGKDIPDEVIAENCRRIIERIKAESPSTTVYLQSILPVNPQVNRFPQHYNKEYQIIHTNGLLREVAMSAEVTFVNIYPIFLDNQQRLEQRYTSDGLHLNEAGYKIWVQFLRETSCL
jgi:lysophospholipase L1-like esterase